MLGVAQEHQVRVGVHVDEAGTHHVAIGVDHPGGLGSGCIATDHRERVARDTQAGPEPGLAGAIDDAPVSN